MLLNNDVILLLYYSINALPHNIYVMYIYTYIYVYTFTYMRCKVYPAQAV